MSAAARGGMEVASALAGNSAGSLIMAGPIKNMHGASHSRRSFKLGRLRGDFLGMRPSRLIASYVPTRPFSLRAKIDVASADAVWWRGITAICLYGIAALENSINMHRV